jgi:hypothetical protein
MVLQSSESTSRSQMTCTKLATREPNPTLTQEISSLHRTFDMHLHPGVLAGHWFTSSQHYLAFLFLHLPSFSWDSWGPDNFSETQAVTGVFHGRTQPAIYGMVEGRLLSGSLQRQPSNVASVTVPPLLKDLPPSWRICFVFSRNHKMNNRSFCLSLLV